MLVTVHKPYHVPHASQIATLGTIFTEIYFGVSKEGVRSWSHVFLVTKLQTLPKKLLAVYPEKATRKNRKKNRMTIAKLFCVKRKYKKPSGKVSSKN